MKRWNVGSILAAVVLAAAIVGVFGEGEEGEEVVPPCKCHLPPPTQYDRDGKEIVFKANGKRIPGGDYRHTCGGCVADHEKDILSCEECMNDDHDLVKPEPVSLSMCIRYHNENGVLVCMPGEEYRAGGRKAEELSEEAEKRRQKKKQRREELKKKMEEELMPQGSFRDTCEGCNVVSYSGVDVVVLTCNKCKISPDSSETTNAMLMIQNCVEVENHGGKLVCVTPLRDDETEKEELKNKPGTDKEHSEL